MDVREKLSSKKRLIDANALLRHKRKMSGADFGGEFWDEAVLASDIENAPTVDAVEVVRCKDCIHRDPEDKKCDCSFQARGGMFPMDDNDFCSYGERRKEDAKIF